MHLSPLLSLLVLTYCQMGHAAAQTSSYCSVDSQSPYYKTQSVFYRQDAPENLPIGSEVMKLLVHGADAVSLAISDPGDDRVLLDNGNSLIINKSLGLQTQPGGSIKDITLDVKCNYAAGTVNLMVIITIVQLNDNAPTFLNEPYIGNISELALIGSPVFTGIATEDNDGDTVFYEILPGPYSDHFWFPNVGQGVVALRAPVDYEEVTEVTLIICAKDSPETTGFNTTTTLTVRILDGDDQNPRFVEGPYMAYLTEGEQLGTVLQLTPQLNAVDPDVNINSPLRYSIIHDSEETEFFSMDEVTGQITLVKNALTRGDKLTFLIRAHQLDNPDRASTTLVRVLIQAANENPPRFVDKEYSAALVENTLIGTTVARVQAVDNDQETPMTVELPVTEKQGAVLTYSFVPQQDHTEYFAIHPALGHITLIKRLSPVTGQSFSIGVSVTDGNAWDYAELLVSVLDVNDHSPVFPRDVYEYDMSGNREQGTLIGRVTATDEDPNTNIMYQFIGNVTVFSLSSAGSIVLEAADSEDLQAVYTLVIRATDNGEPPRQATTVVYVRFASDGATGGVVSGSEGISWMLILVIVLGVLSALLLIAIIVLLVYLYRNSPDGSSSSSGGRVTLVGFMADFLPSRRRSRGLLHFRRQPSSAKEPPNKSIRSQSFEKNLNFASKDYKSYMDQNPSGIAYKQTGGRHMEIYDAVHLDEDSTQTAQNPFQNDDSYRPRHNPPSQRSHHFQIAGVTQSSTSVSRQMAEVNEIDYETAVAPMEEMYEKDMYLSDDTESMSSGGGKGGSRGHKGGGAVLGSSTQQLVSSSSIKKPPPLQGGSNLSFVDSPMNSLYSSNNSQIAPTASALGSQDRPGITIYY